MELAVKTNKIPRRFNDRLICVDTECTGVNAWLGDRPYSVQILGESGRCAYFEWRVDPFTRQVCYDLADGRVAFLREMFDDPSRRVTFHHAKFDLRMLELGLSIKPRAEIHDTLNMAHAVNSQELNYKLKRLAHQYVNVPTDDETLLQKATVSARRGAKKVGWKIAKSRAQGDDEGRKTKDVVGPDYWVPGEAVARQEPWAKPEWDGVSKRYAMLDVVRGLLLFKFYWEALTDPDMVGAMQSYQLERDLFPYVYGMESRGLRLRRRENDRMIERCRVEAQKNRVAVEQSAKRYFGSKQFNIRSTPQIQKLITALGIKVEHRTKTGKPSAQGKHLTGYLPNTTIEHLLKFRAHEMTGVRCFQRFRELAVPDTVTPGCFILHPDLVQVGPKTRRLACKDPNLMGINSSSTGRSFEIIDARGPLGPRPGHLWLLPDYKQVEVVIFADIANEPNMMKAVLDGRDVHTETTNKLFGGKGNLRGIDHIAGTLCLTGLGDPDEKVREAWRVLKVDPKRVRRFYTDERGRREVAETWMRRHGFNMVAAEEALEKSKARNRTKLTVFTKLYGGGPKALSIWSGMTYDESRAFLDDFDVEFPRILEFTRETMCEVQENGYILTAFGDRISVDRDFAYKGVNYKVQGSAAGLLKRAMIRVGRYLSRTSLGHMLLTVHDEIIMEFRRGLLKPRHVAEIQRRCTAFKEFRLPITCKITVSYRSWNDKTPYIESCI